MSVSGDLIFHCQLDFVWNILPKLKTNIARKLIAGPLENVTNGK